MTMAWSIAEVQGKYCVWSSVVDAPISTFCDTVEELAPLVGWSGRHLPISRLRRRTEDQCVGFNRAGPGESQLSAAELLAKYREA